MIEKNKRPKNEVRQYGEWLLSKKRSLRGGYKRK